MPIAAIQARECLRQGWRNWSCAVPCPPACKRSSYKYVQELLAQNDNAIAAINAQAVAMAVARAAAEAEVVERDQPAGEVTVWLLSVEGNIDQVISDQSGLPLIWPRGNA